MSNILVVDDDQHILNLVRLTFQGGAHEVVCLKNPGDVGEVIEKTPVDAIILDVMMPDVSGWEVLDLLRKHPRTQQVPVIILSALSDPEDRARGIRSGADDFVSKPFHPEELIARVEALISRESRHLRGLHGRLEIQPMPDLLQNFEHNSRSGVLEILTSARSGRIELRRGRLLRAGFEGLADGEALLALIEVREGSFRFMPAHADDDGTWNEPLESLHPFLIEAAWLADELHRRRSVLPEPDAVLELGELPAEVPPSFAGLPIEDVAQMLRSRPGLTLDGLVGHSIAAPAKIRLVVAWLAEAGALRPASAHIP